MTDQSREQRRHMEMMAVLERIRDALEVIADAVAVPDGLAADIVAARSRQQINAPNPKRLGFPVAGGQHSGPSEESGERS